MLGSNTVPEATVRFTTDARNTYHDHEEATEEEDIFHVELSYHCPYCDAPNTEEYSYPFDYVVSTTCHHCGYRIDPLFRHAEDGPLPSLAGFRSIPPLIKDLREIRISGETEQGTTWRRFKFRPFVAVLTAVAVVSVVFCVLFYGLLAASVGETVFPYAFLVVSAVAGAAGGFAYSFGQCWGIETNHRWWQPVLYRNLDLYKRGLRRQRGGAVEVSMYQDADTHSEE